MTVNFYARKGTANQGVAIYGKVTNSRTERFQIPTNETILFRHWDNARQCVRSSAPDHNAINLYLDQRRREIITLYRENRDKTWAQFKAMVLGTIDGKKSLASALDRFLEQYKQDQDIKTYQRYKALKAHLFGRERCKRGKGKVIGFVENHGAIGFERLDWNFLDSFRSSLYGKGLQDSSVYRYIANLKTFLAWAEERDYPVNKIFRKWKVIYRVKQVVTLTFHELETLEAADLPEEAAIGRDFLCLEARTGQRISDLIRFDLKDFENDRWTFFRTKGHRLNAKEVEVDFRGFCRPALDILARHNWQMPKFSLKLINKWIKEACRLVGINQEITIEKWQGGNQILKTIPKWQKMSTHIGRKTFITLALREFTTDDVMDMVGIESHKTMKHYKGKREGRHKEQGLKALNTKLKAS